MTICEKGHRMAIETALLKSGNEVEVEFCEKCKLAYVSINDWRIESA